MKGLLKWGWGLGLLACLAARAEGPSIQFAEQIHDFGRVSSGTVVRHEFVFTNTGNAALEITSVRPGCGCTTAGEWDRKVEPGQVGKIPLQLNSTGFSGSISKSATVTCNDPVHGTVMLQLKANIWRPIEITPSIAYFNLAAEAPTNEVRVVRIVSNLDEPLTLTEAVCTNAAFQVELGTVRPGKEYELRVKAEGPMPTRYMQSAVTIKTSSKDTPLLTIPVSATVQPAISVVPSYIMLPAAPRAVPARPSVTVRNAGTNTLVLSDPSVNWPGVKASINEIQPGKVFLVQLEVPAEAQLPASQRVEVSVKSNHPKFPELKVPVYQPSNPAPTPRPATVATPRSTEGVPPLLARPPEPAVSRVAAPAPSAAVSPAPAPAATPRLGRAVAPPVPPLP